MIKINKIDEPDELRDKQSVWSEEYVAETSEGRKQNRFHDRYRKFKSELFVETHDKCAYCESKFRESYFGDVEHIAPKSLYPEKIYKWDNLTAACSICNNNKRANDSNDIPIINPVVDEPADYIQAFGPYLSYTAPGNKGEAAITIIDLNRAELLERRGEKLDSLTKLTDIAINSTDVIKKKIALLELAKQSSDESEYAFISRAYLTAKGVSR
jgi:hypothetical protein